ncbi:MAG: efflux RND transporter periplasmic adaptor subunit, partial [Caldilineaceae bacterium]|nr:efflux RND transporter periplasmic adaptor subunit [Caldilineaceae bacterium]
MTRTTRSLALTVIAAAIAAAGATTLRANTAQEHVAKPSRPALTVSAENPKHADLPLGFTAHGTVAAWQESSIGAEVAGLRLAAVHAQVGDTVRRGQVLASFADETTRAELAQLVAGVAEAKASADEAAANAQRALALSRSGALSDQQITQFLTAEETARARLQAQKAAADAQRWRLTRTTVVAPDDGIISSRTATVGAVMSAGQEL